MNVPYPYQDRFIDADDFFADMEHDEFVGMFSDGHLEILCDWELINKWPVADEDEAFELFKKISTNYVDNEVIEP